MIYQSIDKSGKTIKFYENDICEIYYLNNTVKKVF